MSQEISVHYSLRPTPAKKSLALVLMFTVAVLAEAQSSGGGNIVVHDPGVRSGTIDAGKAFDALTGTSAQGFFADGKMRFTTVDGIAKGLGPTFNMTSCASCHSQPTTGGTSPNINQFPFKFGNPQFEFVQQGTAGNNTLPFFVTADGPVLEARFKFFLNPDGATANTVSDGGVHDVFTIAGLLGSMNCNLAQPNFDLMNKLDNISFRIPTPVFGAGLLETITEETIIANMNADASVKQNLGISGRPNRNGNDGTITRFGWKAQDKSSQIFAGEAYNVEMGITNEQFPNERGNSAILNASNDPPLSCLLNGTPEDTTNFTKSGAAILSDIVEFSHFMRFLDQPKQDSSGIPGNPTASSIASGHTVFGMVGCNQCHTEALTTGKSSFDTGFTTPFLSNQTATLFSDLLVHKMGSGLQDGITQGLAGGSEFRSAPLWGLGQRIFFLHDGRATPSNGGLLTAIRDHDSSGSEAHQVIANFNALVSGTPAQQQQAQDLLNFLRSL